MSGDFRAGDRCLLWTEEWLNTGLGVIPYSKGHRALRLLGQDEHLQSRASSGFQQPDEARWRQWAREDRRVLEEAAGRE